MAENHSYLDPNLSQRRLTRRSHKKSRNGCSNCKQRRIKCNEAKPICDGCYKYFLPCDITPNLSVREPDENRGDSSAPRKRGRPRKDWPIIAKPVESRARNSDGSENGSSNQNETTGEPSYQWDIDDLELLHHYMSDAAFNQGDRVMWQEKVPRLAFIHHYVLHMLLATSALHLARIKADRSEKLTQLADRHATTGIRQATGMLPSMNKDNCSGLYISACLACCFSFAQKPGPQNLLVVSDGCEVPWFNLLRGVRLIVETYGLEAVFSGVLGPFPPPPAPEVDKDPKLNELILEFVPWEEPLQKVEDMISGLSSPKKDICTHAFHSLRWCFEETYGTAATPKPTIIGRFEVVIVWLYRLEDEYVECLEEKHPAALILLAYYAVLLQTLQYCWFMEGWGTHLYRGVAGILGNSYEEWLQWPKDQIRVVAE
ncbi:hypothetical protein F5Y04DRAFT_189620 [Hypomontagnella monticulosa]|nr:hypothetical protein F5Y04DRAFT_189620 [Hypomontagnella monticulosa]